MNWLKDHVYIAAWISPALIGMIIGNTRTGVPHARWSLTMIYVAFLTCMAVVFTPILEAETRIFGGACFCLLGVFIAIHAASDDGD